MTLTRRTLLAASPALIAPSFAPSFAHAGPRVRAVLELFTSQGCSSCPPADRLAAELATDPTLLVVSRPVDYWDNLGWKNSLAQHAFTERQIAYARQRGDGEVYTPQIVVDGKGHAVGSDRDGIEALYGALPLSVVVANGTARVEGGAPGTVLVWWLLGQRTVAIGRGENARAHVTYTNVVLAERALGSSAGEFENLRPRHAASRGGPGRRRRAGRRRGASGCHSGWQSCHTPPLTLAHAERSRQSDVPRSPASLGGN